MAKFYFQFNRFEKTLLIAAGACVLVLLTAFPVMTRLGFNPDQAVSVSITFARSGGFILLIAFGCSIWRQFRPKPYSPTDDAFGNPREEADTDGNGDNNNDGGPGRPSRD